MASGTSLPVLLLPNYSLIAVPHPTEHPRSLWLPLLCVPDGWVVDSQFSRVHFPLLCCTSSLCHISGSPMTCVPVPAVTRYTLSHKNTLTSLCWELQSCLSCFISSLLQTHTRPGGSHTKDKSLELHTSTPGFIPVFEVRSGPMAT